MARWPAVAHIACNRIADAWLKRKDLNTPALRALDAKTIVLLGVQHKVPTRSAKLITLISATNVAMAAAGIEGKS